ncbi:MAG: response regulator, partial [Ilumatobacteraceae bacterium]
MEPDVQLSPRVLLAVGDAQLRRDASSTLRMRGYSVCATTEEEAALTLARSFSPDVVMVDLTLRSPEGGTLFDTMRALTEAYVVAIAAPEADADRIRALRSGADDAVSSDLDTEELAARCHALLRRPRQLHTRWDPMQASIIDFGVLTVDVGRKEIRVHGDD